MCKSTYVPLTLALMVSPPVSARGREATELPIGDGKVTDHPKAGNVFACRLDFRTGGARHVGSWFRDDTWPPLEKPHVQGRVMWPEASFNLIERSEALSVESNGLPVGQPTAIFPISPNDPAYAFDANPNPIEAQSLAFDIPLAPVKA